jgi:hypothetical protein
MITTGLRSLSPYIIATRAIAIIKTCNFINLYATCKTSEYDSDMQQVRWLALGGLSLVLLFLIFKDFTLFGTLLVRFYRRKNNSTQ